MKNQWTARLTAVLLALVLVVALALPAGAAWEMPITTSLPDETIYLVNLDTGEVILNQNGSQARPIASLTKMMTALLVLESGTDLNQTVVVPDRLRNELIRIQSENGSDMKLKVGENVTLLDLLYGLLVPSGNDAASMLADYFGGGNKELFIKKMNARAAELGCTNTHFSCAHGLYDEDNYSTAEDLVRIAVECWKNPQYMEIANTTQYVVPATNMNRKPRELKSTNFMLVPDNPQYRPEISGIKTGFTTLAGRCYVTTTSYQGHNYMLVVLGAQKEKRGEPFIIYQEVDQLLDWLFSRYEDRTLLAASQPVGKLPLTDGADAENVVLLSAGSLVQNVYADAVVEIRLETAEQVKAPVSKGDLLGTAVVTVDGTEAGRLDLVADRDYGSAMQRDAKRALLMLPVLLVVVLVLGRFTILLGHNRNAYLRKKRQQRAARHNDTARR